MKLTINIDGVEGEMEIPENLFNTTDALQDYWQHRVGRLFVRTYMQWDAFVKDKT